MSKQFKALVLGAAVFGAGVGTSGVALADTIYALSGLRSITRIDTETARVIGTVWVMGTGRLAAMDERPSNGKLYGVFENGRVAVINPITGGATLGAQIPYNFGDARYSMDFNPVVDRLRIVGSNDVNLRANVDDGMLTTDTPITGPETNPFGDTNVSVVAASYTNSFPGAVATQLYDIDQDPAALYLQVPPNSGTLSGVGPLNLTFGSIGFDISVAPNGRNRGWMVAQSRLIEIDLAGGAVLSSRPIQGLNFAVRDMAVDLDAPAQ